MSKATQTDFDNSLIRTEPEAIAKKKEKTQPVYDPAAKNRFEFTARMGVKQYETAHIFNPLGDERYMQWLREFKIKGNEDDVNEEAREASVRLWDDQIDNVEKILFPEGEDWRAMIPADEKIEAINTFLAVAIAEDLVAAEGSRVLTELADNQFVQTETFFNGHIVAQTHKLRPSNFEWQKKYARIQAKRFRQEATRGLRRQPKIEFVPQDDKLGELYDEMFVSAEGFANDRIPLRFKTLVVHHLFGEKLDQKKSER